MRYILAIQSWTVLLLMAATAHAGVVGWLTSDARDWDFVRKTGGIRISQPVQRDGKNVLLVEYDVSGRTTVTQRPTLINSGLAVRKIEVRQDGAQIVIRDVTQAVEKGAPVGPGHYADLTGIPAGSYRVYYETAGDAAKDLGAVEIR